MNFSNQARLATLLISTAVVTAAIAQPAPDPAPPPASDPDTGPKALVPTTIDSLQFDGQWPWLFLDRPMKDQGLETLVSRGRVRPYELLVTKTPPAGFPVGTDGALASVRTIFRDLYTGAEIWRMTNLTNGVVSHATNEPWNANGRLIRVFDRGGTPLLFDQETCTMTAPKQGGKKWSPVEPYLTFFIGQNEGVRGVWAFDIMQQKVLRAIAPAGDKWGGLSGISEDGQWVCWLEGGQDLARRFGVAKTDGSLYRSIRWDGGVVFEQSPATTQVPPPTTAGDSPLRGGMHAIRFTRSPDNILKTSLISDLAASQKPYATHFLDTNGKLVNRTRLLSHAADSPDGTFQIFENGDGISAKKLDTEGREWRVLSSKGRTEGHMDWTNDPNWAAASWMSPFGWEILRLHMREGDSGVIRLCSVCPVNPKGLTYNSMPFVLLSPDGTKAMFMSSMTRSMNEYIVVAANPQVPKNLTGQWTPEGFKLTWSPNTPSRETKGYRIYQTNKSGQAYQQIAWVPTPADRKVNSTDPLSFVVPGVKQGEKIFFAARAQEWSGLLSRYSNDVASDASMPVATYIEPERGEYVGFKQGFDPVHASDLYYLFVPTDGTKCSVSFTNPNKDAQVWLRVGDQNKAFAINGQIVPVKIDKGMDDSGWTWINVGKVSGEIKLSSETKGFKLDRIFLTSDGSTPTGRGLDYPTICRQQGAPPLVQMPADVKTKPLTPFAAEVTWAAIPGVRYYNVYAYDRPDFAPAQSNLLYSPPAGTERIVDWGLKPGTQYYYRVIAVDYDGMFSEPSAAVAVATPAITVQTVNLDYAAKPVVLKPKETYTVKFNVPADGDYVIWHQWRTDKSDQFSVLVELNETKDRVDDQYYLSRLYGQVISGEFIWSRYCNGFKKGQESVYHLKAGENTLKITLHSIGRVSEFHLNKLIITNDQSFVPDGKLGIH
ncbi:MAG: fibronectin type III domain-containing protein [Phycisphaerales bacterium]|nr:fibronectin type III domain-containing protein [Phycisphaerales bacterium]